MNILGIDYGTKRIGLAISIGKLAEPLEIVPNSEGVIDRIQTICVERAVEKIVIGISDREMAMMTQQFATDLGNKTNLSVEFIDESYSSVQVHDLLRQSGKFNSQKNGPIDHFVAAYVLQEYLDTKY